MQDTVPYQKLQFLGTNAPVMDAALRAYHRSTEKAPIEDMPKRWLDEERRNMAHALHAAARVAIEQLDSEQAAAGSGL